jgi:hypothetical protein
MSLEVAGWLFTIGVLLHNAEEACWLPAWSVHADRWHPPVGIVEVRFGAVVLSSLLLLIVIAASVSGAGSIGAYLMAGYVLAMVLNVLPHLLATIFMRRYMPGTATAVLMNLPLGVCYLVKAYSLHDIDLRTFIWSGPLVVLLMLASIPFLFSLGRKLFQAADGASS